MDIYNYLKKDHRLVADLMEQVIASSDPTERQTLFEKINAELSLHAETEEQTFYKAIEHATRSKQVEEKLEHANHEHDEIRINLERVSSLSPTDDLWMEAFGELKHSVTHHVEEEESDVFEKAKSYLDHATAVQLAKDMDALKAEVKAKQEMTEPMAGE
ncbi:hemerythrin domain-containing protein [Asticcacaulis sp. 201]|uniref:hemerythrin domain-containing protein n=1 Tax=Asticcacaulis sp. 201 TaxID=3028787 RepID=UPI002916F1D5|nr:hemerythrin domain-containing protein [Asticcacaulis sp. 201]MDV6333257.1 hemerythrin domain-containing protein [Asticcacaulis sp. 201]